ncbi:hypothetical protein ACFFRR_000483 [Megaselia abdita]
MLKFFVTTLLISCIVVSYSADILDPLGSLTDELLQVPPLELTTGIQSICLLIEGVVSKLPAVVSNILDGCCDNATIESIKEQEIEFLNSLRTLLTCLNSKCEQGDMTWLWLSRQFYEAVLCFCYTSDSYTNNRSVFSILAYIFQNNLSLYGLQSIISITEIGAFSQTKDLTLIAARKLTPDVTCSSLSASINTTINNSKIHFDYKLAYEVNEASYVKPATCLAVKLGISLVKMAQDCLDCNDFSRFFVCYYILMVLVEGLVKVTCSLTDMFNAIFFTSTGLQCLSKINAN